jgi:propanol-preferring alcohol dehydrogenase
MTALQLREPAPATRSPLRLVELADPEPAAGELILDIIACAVCRTDLQLVEGDLEPRRLPIVPGHQAVGRVVMLGADVVGWEVGERAGVGWLASACGSCSFCVTGRENLCPDARFTGWDRDGGYATRLAVRADFALRLPDGFDDLAAAPLLCGGVIGYRSLKVSGIQPGGRLGLFGFGASALLALQVARHWGCEVHVRTRSAREQQRALEFGATSAAGYGEPTPPLDAAVTFAPSGDVVVAALRSVARGGTVAINAIHLDRIPEFSYDLLWLERSLRSVANFTRADAREFLELAAFIPIRTAIRTFPLEDGNEALQLLAAGELDATAVLTTGDHSGLSGRRRIRVRSQGGRGRPRRIRAPRGDRRSGRRRRHGA